MAQQLAGTVVVITGASSGIGAATARLLGERDAGLVLEQALNKIADQVWAAGGEALSVATDLGGGAPALGLRKNLPTPLSDDLYKELFGLNPSPG
jgi:NADP-dependent 3-hydroxy acid dehydrogenase YdfG